MKKESVIYKITKIVIDIVFILGIISLFFVPYLVNEWGEFFYYSKNLHIFLVVIIIMAGISALYIVWNLRKILKDVLKDNPFTIESVKSLRRMALGCLGITLIFMIKMIVKFTLPTLVLTLGFGIATLCCLTLKDLFKQALFYKEETDGMV